jgi:hypothetical protein
VLRVVGCRRAQLNVAGGTCQHVGHGLRLEADADGALVPRFLPDDLGPE